MDPQVPNTDTTTAPVNSPTTQEVPKKDNHGITIAALAIFILLSLAAVAFLYYQNQQLKGMLASYQATPTPSATPDATSNWKEYSNENAQISFKYPSQITEVVGLAGAYVSGPIIGKPEIVTGFEDKSTIIPETDAPYDGFTIYEVDPGLINNFTFDSYLNSELKAVKESPRGIPTATLQTINLGNQTFSYIDSETNIRRYFILSPDQKRIVIFSRIKSTSNFPNTFDQILSTFKFSGQSGCVTPPGCAYDQDPVVKCKIDATPPGGGVWCTPSPTQPSSPLPSLSPQ